MLSTNEPVNIEKRLLERKSIKKQRDMFSENKQSQGGSLIQSRIQPRNSKINDKIYISQCKPSKSKINTDLENKKIKKDLAVLKGVKNIEEVSDNSINDDDLISQDDSNYLDKN